MRTDFCKHFDGRALVGSGSCLVGVRYSDVETERLPMRSGLPCRTEAVGTCALRCYPTAEEVAAFNLAVDQALARFAEDQQAGRCHVCHQPMTGQHKVGRCAYAEPCGHRLGQVDGDGA